MKKITSFFLAVILMLSILPLNAKAATGDKLIALTFDDGPHKTYTKQLLDGLKERDVHVTFFMVGSSAAAYPDLVRRAYDEGHEIANHTYNHPNLNEKGSSTVISEISSTASVLNKACGNGTSYIVRPPYGNANDRVLSVLGAPAILWAVDTLDWKYRNSSRVYSSIVNNAYDGAIVLCHDIHSTTIPGALQAVDALKARGYEFVTVSELFRRRGASLNNGVSYRSCPSSSVDHGAALKPVVTYEPEAGGVRVTIESPSGAPVYYSTDGSRLTQQSKKYTGSFVVNCPAQIRAVAAYDLNGDRSDTVTVSIELPPCATPQLSVSAGTMTLSCATSGAPIYYTLDGTAPGAASSRYNGPVTVPAGSIIRAVAGGGDYAMSKELKLYYTKNGNLFADVYPGQWFTEQIDRAVSMGLMNGVGDYKIDPNGKVTRAMVVTMLYRYNGATLEKDWSRTNTFKDVDDGQWYTDAVEWAYINQVVDGYPDNTFKPNQSISRQEMAKIMASFFAACCSELPAGEDCTAKFKDGTKISQWALPGMNAVVAAGLMKGDPSGNLNPLGTATRAEFATVLLRMMELD